MKESRLLIILTLLLGVIFQYELLITKWQEPFKSEKELVLLNFSDVYVPTTHVISKTNKKAVLPIRNYQVILDKKTPFLSVEDYDNNVKIKEGKKFLAKTDFSVIKRTFRTLKWKDKYNLATLKRAVKERNVDVLLVDGNAPEFIKKLGLKNYIYKKRKKFSYRYILVKVLAFLIILFYFIMNVDRYYLLLFSFYFLVSKVDVVLSVALTSVVIYIVENFKDIAYQDFKTLVFNLLKLLVYSILLYIVLWEPKLALGIVGLHGVKLTYFATIIFMIAKNIDYIDLKRDSLIITVILLFLAVILIRTGNYIKPSTWEQNLRDWLDSIFFIRPRFKELFLMPFLAFSQVVSYPLNIYFSILGSIALVSMVNTFMHSSAILIFCIYRSILPIILTVFIILILEFLVVEDEAN